MSLIRAVFGFALAVFLTAFAVLNRQRVEVVFSPVHDSQEVPLYLIALCMLGIGFFAGAAAVWLNGGSLRRVKRRQRRTIKALEREIESLKQADAPDSPVSPPSDFFPALPPR